MKRTIHCPLAAALALSVFVGCATAPEPKKPYVKAPSPSCRVSKLPFKLGIAGFTFRSKTLDESLAVMQRIDTHYLSIKDFHLPLDADDATIAAFKAKCKATDVEYRVIGPLYFDKEEPARKLFEQAKKLGVKTVVVVPFGVHGNGQGAWCNDSFEDEKALDILEKLVKEYDIRAGIHNHGPDMKRLYPTAEAVWAKIKNRDPRIGFCLDVGHQRRAGKDPVAAIRKYADRIYDVHVKNIKIDPVKNITKECPRGELDIPAIFTALAEVGYTGVCHLEYEKDFEDNLAEVAESIGYLRGVMDAITPLPKQMPAPKNANKLTDAEKKDGWQLLWDGKTSAGWTSAKNVAAFPDHGWTMEKGVLTMKPVKGIAPDRTWFPLPPEDQKLGGGGDIVTTKKYRDFEFSFDFRLTKAANSGIKYFVDETQNGGSAEEYQILENFHPDSDKGVDGNRKSASLYDIIPAHADNILKGIGQWNTGKIVAKGNHVEHWLNGKKVLAYERGSEAFRKAVKASKYADWGKAADGKPQPWGEISEGRILIQDHSDSTVSFCNLKIKTL